MASAAVQIITLTTDFGLQDYYLAAMKGVILGIAPAACLVDVTHEVPAQDVRRAAFVLRHAACWFPAGTVHLAVVDPGVGTARLGLAVRAQGQLWVGPDNGLFTFLWRAPDLEVRAISPGELTAPPPSATFHGRDLFAPAAAHLASGVALGRLGPPVARPQTLPQLDPLRAAGRTEGQVVHVDRFGNLVTNIGIADLPGPPERVRVRPGGGREVRGLARTYGDAPAGELLALIGSAGLLEISVGGGSAAALLGAGPGQPVVVEVP
ncbi:MAG: SAM-dependent chlorinase/fluorinase [Candidatus Latescibacterota bacterium]